MNATECRDERDSCQPLEVKALWEIAAQLAELNKHLNDVNVHLDVAAQYLSNIATVLESAAKRFGIDR